MKQQRTIRALGAGIISLIFLLSAPGAAASRLLLERPDGQAIQVGTVFEVEVSLDNALRQDLNAVALEVSYPRERLALKEWSDGDSIVDFWLEKPADGGGRIFGQGVIPGGYAERRGNLLHLYFEVLQPGDIRLALGENSRVLLNDGRGSAASLELSALELSAAPASGPGTPFAFTDRVPPESFQPVLGRDANVYGGNVFLAFSTKDKDAGVDYYEVSEGEEPFAPAQSPYLLRRQQLDVPIRVKAVDKAGNETVAALPAQHPEGLRAERAAERAPGYALGLGLLLLLIFYTLKKFPKQNGKASNENPRS